MFRSFTKDKPVTINFLFDGDEVTWQDLKIITRIQNNAATPEDIQLLMAHFVVDDKGAYIGEEKAVKQLDKLKAKEISEVTTRFLEALQEASIPKASGTSSPLPSEAGPTPTPSPNG